MAERGMGLKHALQIQKSTIDITYHIKRNKHEDKISHYYITSMRIKLDGTNQRPYNHEDCGQACESFRI
jgi:hypothetical protein